ncbi:unnamed protein product [Phytomonas sp. Hart1]|nr:unnamed protein product [Phytomonas sp. Hart1]|eukprot:CCW69611.1 unnamed protein product [Phytomonas sp. isolate Hart1]
MKRREVRRKRERENLSPALHALIDLVPCNTDPRKYLTQHFCASCDPNGAIVEDGTTFLEGDGLGRLLLALKEGCPRGVRDLLHLTRRVPHSRSTIDKVSVAELCFVLSHASRPLTIRERRCGAGGEADSWNDDTPLLQYFKGKRFDAIIRGGNASMPLIRENFTPVVIQDIEPEPSFTIDRSSVGFPLNRTVEDSKAFLNPTLEWEKYLASIRISLPMSLRVHQSERVLRWIALNFLMHSDSEVKSIVSLTKVLPESTAMFSSSNHDYHTHPHTEYVCRTLHAAGAVSFQEVVSAIPVLVLGLQPHHSVLELCAAPGSKTLQMLDETLKRGWTVDIEKSVVIANEKDRVKATQILPARLKRYHAPNVLCTRCDATQWPKLYYYETNSSETKLGGNSKAPFLFEKQFDRIICDVPCSGDGTLRKERSVAATWSLDYIQTLVPTQKALLRRGLDLLKTNGVLVYSTCSINPMEDEEVVCSALDLFRDTVELLDVNVILQKQGVQLRSQGGLHSVDLESLIESQVPSSYNGAKVLRVLPHRDDTGGFFVAAFRKVRQQDQTEIKIAPQKLNQWTRGKLWAPISKNDPVWGNIAEFYSFDRDFFRYYNNDNSDNNSMITTTTDGTTVESATERKGRLVPVYHLNPHGMQSRRIVFITPALANIVFNTKPFKGPGVELVSVGARGFEAYDNNFLPKAECRWRAVVESASYLAPLFSSRKLLFTVGTHHGLLEALFRNGFVYLRDYWWTLLGDESVNASNISKGRLFPFVKAGPLEELLGIAKSCPTDELDSISCRIRDMLGTEVRVGGVLLGIYYSQEPLQEPWFLSATLSGSKLELAVDTSLRGFGLMAFLNKFDSLDSHKDIGRVSDG